MSLDEIFVEEQLMVYLFLLRINPSLKGFAFIKDGVKKIIDDPSKKYNLHKGLYRDISLKFGENAEIVDRSIRHAIDAGFKRNGIVEFEKATKVHFSYCKPAPRELLVLLAELVRFYRDDMRNNVQKYLETWKGINNNKVYC